MGNYTDTPGANLTYLEPPRTIFHGCHSVHWEPPDPKKNVCPPKNIGLGYVKMHGFHGNPLCTSQVGGVPKIHSYLTCYLS